MIWFIVIFLLLVIGAVIGISVYMGRKNNEIKKYYAAAAKIKKEESLTQRLGRSAQQTPPQDNVMVYLKWKSGEKQGYVFDPGAGIRIGRNRSGNQIMIQDKTVSGSHCCVFLYENQVYLQDMGSTNGTWICRMFWKTQVTQPYPLSSGDKFYVGDVKFQIKIFSFDATFL